MIGHYLMFNRNCEEAMETYEQAFGAKISEMMKYGQMPANPAFPVAEADKELVLHAKLLLAGAELMCADTARGASCGDNMYVSYTVKDEEAVEKAWNILKEGGEVYMELQPSFFASLHGSLRDRFGINWMFSALKEMP